MATRRAFLLAGLAWSLARAADGNRDAALWERLRAGGLIIFMRHASTEPGLGDPPGYRMGDCATQRNLSARGREESRRVGERLRAEGVAIAMVHTSPWCRCRETAMAAFGRAQDWTPLGSFFDAPDLEPGYSDQVRKRMARHAGREGNLMMVTHSVNIAALTGHSVGTAELVVVQPDGTVLGRLRLV